MDSQPAIVFPGQGAQTVGMAGDWVDAHPEAAALFARAADILGYDLLGLCREGPAEKLNATSVSQPAYIQSRPAPPRAMSGNSSRNLAASSRAEQFSLPGHSK